MVTGGLAAVIYGHPRLTLDIDLVVRLRESDVPKFAELWPADEFYVPPPEVIEAEARRAEHGHFNIVHSESAMRADIYVAGTSELNAWALERRVQRDIEGHGVYLAPIEAVILGKLSFFAIGGSERHLTDIARMMEVSGDLIDQESLDEWVTRLHLGEAWTRASRKKS
jgi:hypothetical protein